MKRRGFTLVELLVVVLIITILASITMFALFNAGEAAKAARTRAQIAKIHGLLMPMWESYITRRVPINIPAGVDQNTAAQTRVDGIRELMRMEMPDRKSDVEDGTTLSGLARPALSSAYLRKAQSIPGSIAAWSLAQQNAESLYLILARMQDGDSNGLEFFQAAEIGDVDNDNMPEILDGWGTPIRFLRWSPGYLPPYSALHVTSSPDSIDPTGARGTSPTNFALYPLVMSAGADKAFDVVFDDSSGAIHYKDTSPKNNPYATFGGVKIGSFADNDGPGGVSDGAQNYGDNITSHLP